MSFLMGESSLYTVWPIENRVMTVACDDPILNPASLTMVMNDSGMDYEAPSSSHTVRLYFEVSILWRESDDYFCH